MAFDGLDGQGSSDFGPKIPTRTMVQPTSAPVPGLDTNSGDFIQRKDVEKKDAKVNYGKKLNVVVLAASFSRRLKSPYVAGKPAEIICSSRDGKTPDASVATPKADTCGTCDFKNKDLQYRLTCLDVDASEKAGEPVVFAYWTGTSQSYNVKDWYRAIPKDKSPVDYVFTIEGARSPKFPSNELKFSNRREVSGELAKIVTEAAVIYAGAAAATDEDIPF
jgi:hypothetical protein